MVIFQRQDTSNFFAFHALQFRTIFTGDQDQAHRVAVGSGANKVCHDLRTGRYAKNRVMDDECVYLSA